MELQYLFSSFSKASGLQLNSEKSQLFCTSNAELLVERLGIPLSTLPVQHLGLPLQSGYLSNTSCLPLIDKMRKKLQSWTGIYLAKARQTQKAPDLSSASKVGDSDVRQLTVAYASKPDTPFIQRMFKAVKRPNAPHIREQMLKEAKPTLITMIWH
ncbi:hypothetical protein QJS10_CPA01g01524 [Acorus calamus]|uniref:Reverse transcriptase n=1 Tax=Acorus calamus TaxID=4465 RepID=A0AAV9FTT5_ACOCL|nr:hypothetical protein QJS10_CPA01g01524 [Acorus calamus]